MRRAVLLLCMLPVLPGAVRADDDYRAFLERRQAQAKRIGSECGPSIACICVSRSEAYRDAPYWGTVTQPNYPGQLGRFDAAAAKKRVPLDARHRVRILLRIDEHDLSDPANVPESYGSGFVVDRNGLVLTNAHLVRNATKIFVRFSKNRSSWADILASDPYSDLAVLKLLDPPGDLKPLVLGDGGKVRQGQFIFTLANEWTPRFRETGPTVHSGEVTNLRVKEPMKGIRKGPDSEADQRRRTLHANATLIQIDERATPSCSGGALLDLDGKVIGLTSALVAVVEKNGFAIPFDINTHRIIEVLKRGEEVEYGFLGVSLMQGNLRPINGAFLERVIAGMPAFRAGLQVGDRIVKINDKAIQDNSDLFLGIAMGLAGNTVRVTVRRGSSEREIPVKLAKFAVDGKAIAAKRPPARFGLRVDYTSILSQREVVFPRWGNRWTIPEGVIVREVVPGSPAELVRLQPDKLITAVNGRPVTTPAEYYRELAGVGNSVELTYLNSERRPARLTLQEK
jgi:serine protease Do